jgi:hypothetical protein
MEKRDAKMLRGLIAGAAFGAMILACWSSVALR